MEMKEIIYPILFFITKIDNIFTFGMKQKNFYCIYLCFAFIKPLNSNETK